ncbi:competence protein ComK [Niallia sp. Krafla_26]
MFPYKAMNRKDTIWFNSNLLDTALPSGKLTNVIFDGGNSLIVDNSYRFFNLKLLTVDQLRKVNHKRYSL